MAVVLLAMPVVVVAGVGIAMAAPHHHRHPTTPVAAACSSASAAAGGATTTGAGTSSSAAAGGQAAQGGAAEHMTTVKDRYRNSQSPSASAAAGAGASSTTAAAGTTTTTAAAGTTSTTAAAGTTSTTAAAGTTTTTAAAGTTTTAAATCPATTAAAAPPAATPNPNCTLVLPANPTSAAGLATPFQLVATDAAMGPCNEANANQSAFAEAAILTANGQLTLYDPLVVDQGTQPAAPTIPAQVPAGSTVAIWFGFNGTNLTLQSAAGTNALAAGNCVNGAQGSIFGQFAYCNAPAFFKQANTEIGANMLQVPAAGTAKDGQACPTTRDFSVVDQDQSDNVVTHYLANAKGQTAQKNAASMAALGGNATDLANGSDNLLLTKFIDPTIGCTPFTEPDQSSDGQASGALPLDELSAMANQKAPIAMVPLNDPMALNNGNQDAAKANLYRAGVDQALIGQGGDNGSGATYCQSLFGNAGGIARVFKDQAMFQNGPSVDAAMASNLFTFLAMRANQSFTNLGCQNLLNMPNPIALTMDGNGVVTAAVMVPLGQNPPANAGGAANGGGANGGGAAATTPAAGGANPTPSATQTRHPRRVRW